MARPRLKSSRQQVVALRRAVRGRPRGLVLTHDSPDPDAMAAALCMARVLERAGLPEVRIVHGGSVGRPQNRAMVRALELELWPAAAIEFRDQDAVIVVDTQPGFGNNSLPRGAPVCAVIDHHTGGEHPGVALVDVRCGYGAATSVTTEYVVSAGVPLSPDLATAICFGISTETQDLGREASDADVAAFLRAFPHADQPLLGRLRHPSVSVQSLAQLVAGLRAACLAADVVACHVPEPATSDAAAELADVLISVEDANWAFVSAVWEGELVLSVRTTDPRAESGELLREVVGNPTLAGGHGMVAGGAVALAGSSAEMLHWRLAGALVRALGRDPEGEWAPLLPPDRAGL